ncbi:MAG: hypothetical protein ACRENU_17590 [Gemmatimonadaceae bacterium]
MRRVMAAALFLLACSDNLVVGNFELPLKVKIRIVSITPIAQEFVVHFRAVNEESRAVLIRGCGDHVQVKVNGLLGADSDDLDAGLCPAGLQVQTMELKPGAAVEDSRVLTQSGWYHLVGWIDNDGRGRSEELLSPPFEVR